MDLEEGLDWRIILRGWNMVDNPSPGREHCAVYSVLVPRFFFYFSLQRRIISRLNIFPSYYITAVEVRKRQWHLCAEVLKQTSWSVFGQLIFFPLKRHTWIRLIVPLLYGLICGEAAIICITANYIPSTVRTILRFRSGGIGSLHDKNFLKLRIAGKWGWDALRPRLD